MTLSQFLISFNQLSNSSSKNPHVSLLSPFSTIYQNLALEELLMASLPLTTSSPSVLLLYINDPCVVVGLNQHIWREAFVPGGRLVTDRVKTTKLIESVNAELSESNTSIHSLEPRYLLARRRSGGGAVYHDRNNLCLSFVTCRQHYRPSSNMTLVCDWINSQLFSKTSLVPTESDKRFDLLFNGRKVSGSAMRLTRQTALHHLTLLIKHSSTLQDSLRARFDKRTVSETAAIPSVPSPVTSLSEGNLSKEWNAITLAEWIAQQYGQDVIRLRFSEKDDDWSSVETQQTPHRIFFSFQQEVKLLQSPEWIFGKTPAFTSTVDLTRFSWRVTCRIKQGRIETVTIMNPHSGKTNGDAMAFQSALLGTLVYCPVSLSKAKAHCLQQMMEHTNEDLDKKREEIQHLFDDWINATGF